MDLPEPAQHRGPWTQDISPVERVDLTVANRADPLPAGAGAVGQPQRAAHDQDGPEDVVHRALIGAQHGETGAQKLGGDVGLEIRERQHQLGLELDDAVDPKRRESAHPRLVARLGRARRGAGHAHHPVARAQGIADLYVLGREADDAPRELCGGLAVHAWTIPDAGPPGCWGFPMLYCARMLGPSTEEVPVPEPRRPARYFSPWFTALCTVVAVALVSLYAAPWRGSPLDQLERPAESLERMVTRDLDVRDALRSAPRWEHELYAVFAGADDSVAEALRWYDELLEVVDGETAALYHAILQAEAGEPAPDEEQADEAVVAAYSSRPVSPEEAPAPIPRIRSPLPRNWFTDTLVSRIARKGGDLPTPGEAQTGIPSRGPRLLRRWPGLT